MFEHKIEKLRAPDRIAQMEAQRVVNLCMDNCRFEDVLDVGTGSGLFAEAFAARKIRVIGVDPDTDMIAAARYYTAGIDFSVGAAEALPFTEDSFEALFMGMVLHETTDPLLALREARRVARKNLAILEWPFPQPGDPPPPARRFARQEIVAMSRAAGFSTFSINPLRRLILYLLH